MKLKIQLHHIIPHFLKLLVIPGVLFLLSCENDIEKIKSLTSSEDYPDVSGKKVEMIYSDSGKVRVLIVADEIRKYSKTKKPYVEFPKGIDVQFFDDSLGVVANIVANYAIYYNELRLWEARGNVIAEDIENGKSLYSEELFWDENKEIIYSNIFSRIENKNGTFYGQNGFEADQKLTHLRLKSTRGNVKLKDELITK